MTEIARNIEQASGVKYDVVIIGGGIYGAMTMLESARAGLKPLLLEKSDFGSGTSFNNLRIVHGGLRYLQTLHMSRFKESVAERRWLLKTFPALVRPLPCLMPLYGGLIKNRLVLKAALAANDFLSRSRNEGLESDSHIPNGEVLGVEETRTRFPGVRLEGLQGAALWYDAVMPDCNRLEMEVLRWSVAAGGTALNYVEVTDTLQHDDRVAGVVAIDHVTGEQHEFSGQYVINAAGPGARALARHMDADREDLFRPSLAWNLLFDRPPLSSNAVAVQAPVKNSRVYFAHSIQGKLVVGTGHAPLADGEPPVLQHHHIEQMLEEFNQAIPGLDLSQDEVIRVFAGQLPAKQHGTVELSDTPIIVDHRRHGGPAGLVSVSGVKYTTARKVADETVSVLVEQPDQRPSAGLPPRPPANEYHLHPADCPDRGERIRRASHLVALEAPKTLEDLLLRRSNLASDPQMALEIAPECCEAFDWIPAECASQIESLRASLRAAGWKAVEEGSAQVEV